MIDFFEENIIYYKAFYIIYSIVSVTLLREIPFFTGILSAFMVFISFVYFCIFCYKGYYNKINKTRYLLVLFLIIQCGTFFTSKNYVSDLIRLVFNGIYFLIISNNIPNNKRNFNNIFKIISPIILIVILSSSLLYIFNISFEINGNIYGKLPSNLYFSKDFVGVTVNSNTLGILCSFLSMILIHLLLTEKNKGIIYYIGIIISVTSLFITQSRGAILLLGIYIICLGVLSVKNKKKMLLIVAFLLIFTIPLIISYLNKNALEEVSTGRSLLWKYAFDLIQENKLLGVGTTEFITAMKNSAGVYLPGIEAGGVHNIYIQIALTNGLIAFVIFIIFLITMCITFLRGIYNYKNIKGYKFNISLFSMIISILCLNLVESSLLYICSFIALIFWISVGELYSNFKLRGDKYVV